MVITGGGIRSGFYMSQANRGQLFVKAGCAPMPFAGLAPTPGLRRAEAAPAEALAKAGTIFKYE